MSKSLEETLAERMHEEWLEVMAEQGYHSTEACPNRPSEGIFAHSNCDKCRPGLVPWSEVPEPVKEVNRRGAKAFLREVNISLEAQAVDVGEAVRAIRRGIKLERWGGSRAGTGAFHTALRSLGVRAAGMSGEGGE